MLKAFTVTNKHKFCRFANKVVFSKFIEKEVGFFPWWQKLDPLFFSHRQRSEFSFPHSLIKWNPNVKEVDFSSWLTDKNKSFFLSHVFFLIRHLIRQQRRICFPDRPTAFLRSSLDLWRHWTRRTFSASDSSVKDVRDGGWADSEKLHRSCLPAQIRI